MQTVLPLQICAARELTAVLRGAALTQQKVGTVLSIEDPGFARVAQEIAGHQPPLEPRAANVLQLQQGLAPRLQDYYAYTQDPAQAARISDNTRATAALTRQLQQTITAFVDVEDARLPHAPQRWHVGLARDTVAKHMLQDPKATMISQCVAGLSRSPAMGMAAIIAAYELVGRRKPDACDLVDTILAQRRKAMPNLLIVHYTDTLFGYGGKLLRTVERHPIIVANRNGGARQAAGLMRGGWAPQYS